MNAKPLSQEGLKAIACAAMLLDHVGAVFFPQNLWLRVIGRVAFPLYCFLLAEGVRHTKNPLRYGLRLLIGLVLAEIPFDLALFGEISFAHQSVMFTLLLAFLAIQAAKRFSGPMRFLGLIPILLAELLQTDYGAMGVLTAVLFYITRNMEEKILLQTLGLLALGFSVFSSSIIQFFAVLAMLPISLYSGKKVSSNKILQWGFYLFYPAHLLVLWALSHILSF